MLWGILNLVLSFLETAIIWLVSWKFMSVNRQTIHRRKPWYILVFLLAAGIQYTYAVWFSNSWSMVLIHMAVMVAAGALLFHREILALILDIVFAAMVVLGLECGIFISNIILSRMGIYNFPGAAAAGCLFMGIKILFLLVLTIPMIRWRKSGTESRLTLRQTLTMLVLPFFSLFFLYSLVEVSRLYVQLQSLWLIIFNIVGLVLLNVYFLYLLSYLFKAGRLEQEMNVARARDELQYRYYGELEQKYRESRKILHDMKNHLSSVEQLYREQNKTEGDAYVKDLYHMIHVLGEKYYSSNHMLNIILNEKLSRASVLGISVKVQAGDVSFDDWKDMDITTVFANLLDNALEACEAVKGNAYLDIKIDRVQDFRVIQLENSRKNDSGKKKQGHMGLGLLNVKQTVEKYHGTLEQTVTDSCYRVCIMLPGKEQIWQQ